MCSPAPALRKLIDDFSYQVYSDSDERFWFRLVRDSDCDIITDFFLGAFPSTQAATLLMQCYKTLGLTPAHTIKFADIYPSQRAGAPNGQNLRMLYADAGRRLLAESGAANVEVETEQGRDRTNLVVRRASG